MTFEYTEPPCDLPNELQGLFGLGALGIAPLYLIAGGVTAGAALMRFLESDEWSSGEYNNWMLKIDQTLHEWDKLGWSKGCWQKHPEARRQWLTYWERFSKHYKEHGRVTSNWVSDSEEKPARVLLQELIDWGTWLNTTCGIDTGPSPVQPPPPPPGPDNELTSYLKWGAIGLAAIAALAVFSGVRDAFPRRRY